VVFFGSLPEFPEPLQLPVAVIRFSFLDGFRRILVFIRRRIMQSEKIENLEIVEIRVKKEILVVLK
jgi:hypothetical protein